MNVVYGVHLVRSDEMRPTEVIFTRLAAAERHAKTHSRDTDVLAREVTRYVLDEPGQRTPTTLYVAGKRQQLPYISDSRDEWGSSCWRDRRCRALALVARIFGPTNTQAPDPRLGVGWGAGVTGSPYPSHRPAVHARPGPRQGR